MTLYEWQLALPTNCVIDCGVAQYPTGQWCLRFCALTDPPSEICSCVTFATRAEAEQSMRAVLADIGATLLGARPTLH